MNKLTNSSKILLLLLCSIFNSLFVSFFLLYISCSLDNFSSFILFSMFFKSFNSSLNSSIIVFLNLALFNPIYLLNNLFFILSNIDLAFSFNIFELSTICFGFVPKSLYFLVSASEEITFVDSIST